MKLLHIDASILGANSVSRQIAGAVVDRLRQTNPGLDVSTYDLAADPLPHLSLSNLPSDHPIAVSMGGAQDERAASQSALEAFLAADVVVIGAPMYNFTLPSQLKAWIDRILVPGKTFQQGPEGVKGLAGGKRVIIAISRGGLYGADTPFAAAEHLETYLRAVFGIIGVTDLEVIVAEGVQMGPEHRSKAVEAALQAATELRAA